MRVGLFITNYKKRLTVLAATAALSLGLVITPAASALTIGGPSDCDNNAIIRCGAHSTAQLVQAYRSSDYVQKVYTAFGVTAGDMANLPNTNVPGRVTKDGKVFVDGQSNPVANGAITGGRQNMAGSTAVNSQGAVFYKRPPSVSFQQASLPAFVSMKNGSFQFAVIASCGNAVRANAVAQPHVAVGQNKAVSKPQPKPQPAPQPKAAAPAPTQTQSQEQAQFQAQGQSQEVTINNSNTQNIQTAPQQTAEKTTETVQAEQAPATETVGKLVDTGPTASIGAFLLATTVGTLAYRRWLTRRLVGSDS